jgi:hypothetical protein
MISLSRLSVPSPVKSPVKKMAEPRKEISNNPNMFGNRFSTAVFRKGYAKKKKFDTDSEEEEKKKPPYNRPAPPPRQPAPATKPRGP